MLGGTSSASGKGSNKSVKMVQSTVRDDPMSYLHSSDDSDEESKIKSIRVSYEGSRPRRALVEVQGIPAYGIVDTGADISIMGAKLFKTIAAAIKMKKRRPWISLPLAMTISRFSWMGS